MRFDQACAILLLFSASVTAVIPPPIHYKTVIPPPIEHFPAVIPPAIKHFPDTELSERVAQIQEMLNKVAVQLPMINEKMDKINSYVTTFNENKELPAENQDTDENQDIVPSGAHLHRIFKDVCKDNFFTTEKKRTFYYIDLEIDWYGARDRCKKLGMHHASRNARLCTGAFCATCCRSGY